MEVERLEYINTGHTDDLTARLKGNVFHLTSQSSFDCISAENRIYHNRDGKFPIYAGSANGFGKNRGYVPFFNFRNTTDEIILDTRNRYNFEGPTWFRKYHPDYSESSLAYLFLSEQGQKELIPNNQARVEFKKNGHAEQYIPDTEFWYPGNVSLELIEKVLLVRIFDDAPKKESLFYAHYSLLVNGET